jgi:hypothetical protein
MREAGRRKLDQYRMLKQKCRNGDIDDIITGAGFGVRASSPLGEDSKSTKEQDVPAAPKDADTSRSDQQSLGLGPADPMIDCLLAQVNNLMQERQALQAVADQLRRENEQLHELVGYLSLQQGVLSSSEDGEEDYGEETELASPLEAAPEEQPVLHATDSGSSSGVSEGSNAMSL